jgi:uncharacterized protein YutE (UPF0331/DUF86 family)
MPKSCAALNPFRVEIDHGRSYDAIREDLGDLEKFAAAMARLLRSTP